MNRQARMPLLILWILIAFFLSSNFGNAFVLHANEDSKLHRQRATSMNKQTMNKRMMQQQAMSVRMMHAEQTMNKQISKDLTPSSIKAPTHSHINEPTN